jgi:hypothetical protein
MEQSDLLRIAARIRCGQYAGFFYSPNDTPPSGADILRSERIAPNWFIFDWHF